jgi:beta-galactosidase
MFDSSRRNFLLKGSTAAASVLLSSSTRSFASQGLPEGEPRNAEASTLRHGWQFRRGPTYGIEEIWRAGDDDRWSSTELPHCFNGHDAVDPDEPYFQGAGWYRLRLPVHNPFPNGRTLLHFQGAGQTTTVWVGSEQVGRHKGGYDEFAFDITEAVKQTTAAEVPIAVLCENYPDLDRVPSNLSDFCLYGGLYRHVHLIYLPSVALEALHIHTAVDSAGTESQHSVRARLYNPTAASFACQARVEVFDPHGQSVHRSVRQIKAWSDTTDLVHFSIARPKLWSPDTPQRYRCRVTLVSDAGESFVEQWFGVRHVEFVEHGPFLLNGRRLLLQGTHRHADHADVAAAMSDEQVRAEMTLIREMGANFIRLAHYQQDRLVLDLCDELGLMVWEEAPWCRAGVGSPAFQQNAKEMLTHMIDQHFNHPSIILWGLGNEDDWPDEYPGIDETAIRAFMTEMRNLAHQLDDTRLTSFRRCDFARDIPDVYSPSIWAGWYRGDYREYEASLLKEKQRTKRLLHMEWGADSHARRHSEDPEAALRQVKTGTGTDERGLDYLKQGGEVRVSKDGDCSETYACNLFDWYLKTQETLDWLTGSAQWIFKDFASPLRSDNSLPKVNQKGVVERDLTKKEAYYVFQSYWSVKPMAHIYGHTWPVRWGTAGQQRLVKVYSNCDHAELFVNGRSQGIRHRNSQDFPAAGLRWNVVFTEGHNRLRVEAHRASITVIDEIEQRYQTAQWSTPSELRVSETSRTGDVITAEATLHDKQGVLCLDARTMISFSLAGPGRLLDNRGTTTASRTLQLYNGRAQISFTREGACMLAAAADGLPTGFLSVL